MSGSLGQSSKGTLRQRMLAFVGALVLLSLFGSTISLYRISDVNNSLDAINRVLVPLGKILTQINSDAALFRRELDRSLGSSHWNDPHWRARPVPRWIGDVIDNELGEVRELVTQNSAWATDDSRKYWRDWNREVTDGWGSLREDTRRLYAALDANDEAAAAKIYPKWSSELDDWTRRLQWGLSEHDRSQRQAFSSAQARVTDLRTGLEVILVVVVTLSLLLLWLGERALRPLAELTRLAREITRRGLRKEDKSLLLDIPLSRTDEVSQLAREFHHMATSLLEREKTVEAQKHRLVEQNRLLREMGELNVSILNSIDSVLLVADLEGRVTQCNPEAVRWLGAPLEQVIGSALGLWEKIRGIPGWERWIARVRETREGEKIDPCPIEDRVFGGHALPLKQENGEVSGVLLSLVDLTDDLELQERLRRAENMAAVGRMSAQVAHEVRNPLHSIGLEAEMAADMAAKLGSSGLKQSLQSILSAVDRLEKITQNYLKLSRLSAGEKNRVDLGEVLETVLATYAPACEAQGVSVNWTREAGSSLLVWGDRDLLEQVLGNLFRNALQALERHPRPEVRWSLGSAESGRIWLKIEDNGPGISPEVRPKLFTPFTTTRAQGTGLGLSFVKKVIEDHGGNIICAADRELGACFEIVLPCADRIGLEHPTMTEAQA